MKALAAAIMTLWLILSIAKEVMTWKEFAEPLVIPRMKNAPFFFELDVQWRLTMSVSDESNKISIVDYSSNEKQWYLRNMDPLMSCSLQEPLMNSSSLETLIQLNGLHRRTITINGKSPAQPIVVPLGAEVIMRVHNNLITEGLTIHVHGLDKRNAWFADGVPFIQQCPIPAGIRYSYRFIADVPGTHWYHGHYGTDRGEGLLGAFVVTKEDERVTNAGGDRVLPSRQYVVMLQDLPKQPPHINWNNQNWGAAKWMYGYEDRSKCYSSTRTYDGTNVGGAVPLSAIIVNDKGYHNQTEITMMPWSLPMEKLRITAGEKILLRIIHGGLSQALMITIEGHKMTVVAADGLSVNPLKVDMIVMVPGERYDILIEGKTAPRRTVFYIILETLEHYDGSWKKNEPFYGAAQLVYEASDEVSDEGDVERMADFQHQYCLFIGHCLVLNCPFTAFPKEFPFKCVPADALRSLEPDEIMKIIAPKNGFSADGKGYQEHFINMHFDNLVNQWNYQRPKGIPYFYYGREHEIAKQCDPNQCPPNSTVDCPCFVHLNITLGSVVQLTIYNMGEGSVPGLGFAHPFHIHGTHFYLIKMGFGTFNETTGITTGTNTDLPCNAENLQQKRCNGLKWTNSAWNHGRVDGINSVDPSFRDTVVVPAGGYIVVRFLADHAGWYFAHCHTMDHEMDGMAFAMRIGEHHEMPEPPENFPHSCGVFEQPPLPAQKQAAQRNASTAKHASDIIPPYSV